MIAEPVITVEVTITDELRRLWALRVGGAGLSVRQADPAQMPAEPELTPQAPDLSAVVVWQQIVLRRDGERPLVFRGLPILTRRCVSDKVAGSGEQTLAFYLAEDRTIYASLIFEPPETTPARPAHQCQPIRDQSDLVSFVRGWYPEMSFEAGIAWECHQHLAAAKSAVRSAFNSMAADCLCKGVLLA